MKPPWMTTRTYRFLQDASVWLCIVSTVALLLVAAAYLLFHSLSGQQAAWGAFISVLLMLPGLLWVD